MATFLGSPAPTKQCCLKRKIRENSEKVRLDSREFVKTLHKLANDYSNLRTPEKTIDYELLQAAPDSIRKFFVNYVKQVHAIGSLFDNLCNHFENYPTMFHANDEFLGQVRSVASSSTNGLNVLTESVVKKLGEIYSSHLCSAPAVKVPRFDSVEDKDEDLAHNQSKSAPSKSSALPSYSRSSQSRESDVSLRWQRIEAVDASEGKGQTYVDLMDDEIDFSGSDIDLQLEEIADKVCENELAHEKTAVKRRRDMTTVRREHFPSKNDESINNLNYDPDGFVKVFVDGSCLSNGRHNAQAGIGVWFGENHPLNVSERATGLPTNNNAEIQAATQAILKAKSVGVKKLRLCTDSQFVINCMTKWIFTWKQKNWINSSNKPVINKDSLIELDKVMPLMEAVDWKYVEGHKGVIGNERADFLAKAGARK